MNSRKRGMFREPDQAAKRMAGLNPEYQAAFKAFDRDNSGTIDIGELHNALQAVKQSVETSTPRAFLAESFSLNTVMWLAAHFAQPGSNVLHLQQFAEILQYIESVRKIFEEIDLDHDGSISVSELSRALSLSGFNVTGLLGGGDTLSLQVAGYIGRAYDADGDGVLKFDEFIMLRCEWDAYLQAWGDHVPAGSTHMSPQQTLEVLEQIKTSMEPIGALARSPSIQGLAGFDSNMFLGGLCYSSMFERHRPFSLQTCEMLILRFGNGNPYITFEQFCMLMEFLKEQKKRFTAIDLSGSGKLDLTELTAAFAASGMPFRPETVIQIGQRYDEDKSGSIEFDEFLQMMAEWTQVASYQQQFTTFGQQKATAQDIQELFGGIRIFYQTIGGAVPAIRPFSLNTCRWLIAMYGTCMPGEHFPTSVTYVEFLHLVQHVKSAALQFMLHDPTGSGNIPTVQLMSAFGSLSEQVVPMMLKSYDYDQSGTIEFDEYLQMLLETQLFEQRIRSLPTFNEGMLTADPITMFKLLYSMPRAMLQR